jgi:hypothetical protein
MSAKQPKEAGNTGAQVRKPDKRELFCPGRLVVLSMLIFLIFNFHKLAIHISIFKVQLISSSRLWHCGEGERVEDVY